MDYDFAVDWVSKNKGKIIKYVKNYLGYSPYDKEDFLSAAKEAALIAVLRAQNDVPFGMMFWTCFRDLLRTFVPNPHYEDWSQSIPSYLCSPDIPDDIPSPPASCSDLTTECIFQSLSDYLPDKDKTLLSLVLGLGEEGKLSYSEVGHRLGCSKQNVAKSLQRCLRDIQKLVKAGRIDRKVFPMLYRMRYLS